MSERHPHPDRGKPEEDCVVCRLEERIDSLTLALRTAHDRLIEAEALIGSLREARRAEGDYERRNLLHIIGLLMQYAEYPADCICQDSGSCECNLSEAQATYDQTMRAATELLHSPLDIA